MNVALKVKGKLVITGTGSKELSHSLIRSPAILPATFQFSSWPNANTECFEQISDVVEQCKNIVSAITKCRHLLIRHFVTLLNCAKLSGFKA